MHNAAQTILSYSLIVLFLPAAALAQSRKAPPGMFKDLNDEIAGDAILIHNKQLFIDDYVIGDMQGLKKQLNRPVKHMANPLVVKDQPWEEGGPGYSTVLYDAEAKLFKLWYGFWIKDAKPSEQVLCYATSRGAQSHFVTSF